MRRHETHRVAAPDANAIQSEAFNVLFADQAANNRP
jgi:hypothetical protein